jgi:hypothetical protein
MLHDIFESDVARSNSILRIYYHIFEAMALLVRGCMFFTSTSPGIWTTTSESYMLDCTDAPKYMLETYKAVSRLPRLKYLWV